MPRIDFDNNRGENLADPKYDKDAVNRRTLIRNVKTIKGSFLSTLTGGTVNGDVTITGDTTIGSSLNVSGSTTIGSNLTVSGSTTIEGGLVVNNVTKTTGRIKNTREITIRDSDYSTNPSQGFTLGDEIIFIKDILTGNGAFGEYNFNLSNFLFSPEGTTFEIIKIQDGSGGQIRIGATSFLGSYTLNGTTNGQLNVCNDIHTSVTIVKSGSTAIICYGTGL